MNKKSVPVLDEQLDFQLITLTVFDCDFDLDKAAKQLKWGFGKRRIADALARWEAHIVNVERTTRDPDQRLVLRRLLAGIRKTRHPPAGEPT